MPKKVGGYEIGPTIGIGSLGRVRLGSIPTGRLNPKFVISSAQLTNTGQSVTEERAIYFAARQVSRDALRSDRGEEKLRRDVLNLMLIQHPHILSLYEVVRTQSSANIIAELAPNCTSLLEMVLEFGKMDEPDAREIFQRVVCAIRFCHTNKVPHRGIKPSCIFLVPTPAKQAAIATGKALKEKNNSPLPVQSTANNSAANKKPSLNTHSVKISNTGLATVLKPPAHPMLAGVIGSEAGAKPVPISSFSAKVKQLLNVDALRQLFLHPHYAPPEAMRDSIFDAFAADVWSLGVLLYFMLSGALPFAVSAAAAPNDFDSHVGGPVRGSVSISAFIDFQRQMEGGDFRMPKYLTSGAKRLLARMLTVDPRRRISMDEILTDPWFAIDFNSALQNLGLFEAREPPLTNGANIPHAVVGIVEEDKTRARAQQVSNFHFEDEFGKENGKSAALALKKDENSALLGCRFSSPLFALRHPLDAFGLAFHMGALRFAEYSGHGKSTNKDLMERTVGRNTQIYRDHHLSGDFSSADQLAATLAGSTRVYEKVKFPFSIEKEANECKYAIEAHSRRPFRKIFLLANTMASVSGVGDRVNRSGVASRGPDGEPLGPLRAAAGGEQAHASSGQNQKMETNDFGDHRSKRGPHQELINVLQAMHCKPSCAFADEKGQELEYSKLNNGVTKIIEASYNRGQQQELPLDVVLTVVATAVPTLYLVVVEAMSGSASDFDAFFEQLERRLGPSVASKQIYASK